MSGEAERKGTMEFKGKITPLTKEDVEQTIAEMENTVFGDDVEWLLAIPEMSEAYEKRKESIDKIVNAIKELAKMLAYEIVSAKSDKETQKRCNEEKPKASRETSKDKHRHTPRKGQQREEN